MTKRLNSKHKVDRRLKVNTENKDKKSKLGTKNVD